MIPNFYDRDEHSIIQTLQGMVAQGLLRIDDQGLYEAITSSIDLSNLYLFTGEMAENCLLQFDIIFKRFGMISGDCLNCWKVVVKCRTVFELFQVWDLFRKERIDGKAGVDEREFTQGFYVAFAYNHSLEQGRATWTRIVELIHREIGGHFLTDFVQTVILKRGCTEMESRGPSSSWHLPEGQLRFEQKVNMMLAPIAGKQLQPDWLIRHKLRRWCSKAHMIGDMSYSMLEPVTGPIEIGVKSVTYHQKEWLDGA